MLLSLRAMGRVSGAVEVKQDVCWSPCLSTRLQIGRQQYLGQRRTTHRVNGIVKPGERGLTGQRCATAWQTSTAELEELVVTHRDQHVQRHSSARDNLRHHVSWARARIASAPVDGLACPLAHRERATLRA
jgi:hypothetical protein